MKRFIVTFVLFLALFGVFRVSSAAELYIDKNGKVLMRDGEIFALNNNVITVLLWGTHWVFFVDEYGKVTNAAGEPITVWQLNKGDNIYVEGEANDSGIGKIEINVTLLRDMSIPGKGPAIAVPQIKSSVPVVPLPASPQVVSNPSPITPSAGVAVPPTTAKTFSGKILARGMSGEEVKKLQDILVDQGYLKEDDATGFFGEATERAVKKLQKANNLSQEGSVGPATQKLINAFLAKQGGRVTAVQSAPAQKTVSAPQTKTDRSIKKKLTANLHKGMNGGEVVILQEFLQKSGFGIPNDGPVTGVYGSVTEKAVADFQQANSLEATGSVGPLTRVLINKLLGN